MKYVANPVEVDAFVIRVVWPVLTPGNTEMRVTLDDGRVIELEPGMTARMDPAPGDYFVVQSDGYAYLNPKAVFERKYSAAGQRFWAGTTVPITEPRPKVIDDRPVPSPDDPGFWPAKDGGA